MSLAPPWAKAAAVLGLKMQRDMLLREYRLMPHSPALDDLVARIREYDAEIERIEGMKN